MRHLPPERAGPAPELLGAVRLEDEAHHADLLPVAADDVFDGHRLIAPADEVVIERAAEIEDALRIREGRVGKEIIHIEGMPGKGHAVFAHELRAVDERVHQKHLPKAQRPRFLPGKEPAL